MKTDIETLVLEADPVRHSVVPTAGSPRAERIWDAVDPEAPSLRRESRRRRIVVPVSVACATATAAALVALQFVPTPVTSPANPAAAALRLLAGSTGGQSAPTLSWGQWLHTQFRATLAVSFSSVGSTPTPNATATIETTINAWSNTNSTACTQETLGVPNFASALNEQAWSQAGLSSHSVSSGPPDCVSEDVVSSQATDDLGVMDVSRLPTDASSLANELKAGTTGIARLDRGLSTVLGTNPAFGHAVLLLVGPTVGATPRFWSALLDAMSTMPGVSLLGTRTTHSGATGIAFAAQTGLGRTTVVLSPSTGALLEARNIITNASFQSVIEGVRASLAPFGVKTAAQVTVESLDPVAPPTVVDDLPQGTQVGHLPSTAPTATIDGTTRPGVTSRQDTAFANRIMHVPGVSSMGGGESSTRGVFTFEVTTHGSPTEVKKLEAALRSADIVASITVHTA